MNGATIYGLSPEDLAYAKLAAGRPKDIDFIARMIGYKIVSQVSIARLIGSCADAGLKSRLAERLTIAVGLTQSRDEQGRAPGLSDPVRRAIGEGRGEGGPERWSSLSGVNRAILKNGFSDRQGRPDLMATQILELRLWDLMHLEMIPR
jgi:hypothetical protein